MSNSIKLIFVALIAALICMFVLSVKITSRHNSIVSGAHASEHVYAIPCRYSVSKRLVWDANTEQDLAGYRVHIKWYGMMQDDSRVVDVGNRTTHIAAGLCSCITYEFAVTAYDKYGNESNYNDRLYITPGSPDLDGDGDVDGSDLSLFAQYYCRDK
jgi:hypothetical protein